MKYCCLIMLSILLLNCNNRKCKSNEIMQDSIALRDSLDYLHKKLHGNHVDFNSWGNVSDVLLRDDTLIVKTNSEIFFVNGLYIIRDRDAKNIYRGFKCYIDHDEGDPPYCIYAYNSQDTVAYSIHNMVVYGENNFIIDYAHFKDRWFDLSGVTTGDEIGLLWNRLGLFLQGEIIYNHIAIIYNDSIREKDGIPCDSRCYDFGISLLLDLKDNIITDIYIYPKGYGQELYCKLPETCWIGYIKNAE